MIPQITEHFGSDAQYATLHQATVSFTEMGDRTISTQVRIDGDHVPQFDDWYVTFKGEKFVLPIKEPQAAKNNTTRNSLVDLTFYSWVTYQLKRYLFMSMSQVETGVYIPDQYNAPVNLSVENFVTLFNRVLSYYYGSKIQMDLFNAGQGVYSDEPVLVEINKTYIWDVLIKFYELYGLRWRFQYDSTNDIYYIKVGYPAPSIDDHDFEYGYQGGLLSFERQVQDDDINNILLGRGGEKNLPYRYFKKVDPQNPNWTADPDAIPELALANFDRLRDATFRWYVRGWMQNPNCDQAYAPYPQYSESDIPGYGDETDKFFLNCRHAFRKGQTDSQFNPVETSRDFDSIEKYGERWGALDDNDDVYPTIQGLTRSPIGRIDETVAVSEIITDDIEAMAENAAVQKSINPLRLALYGNTGTSFTLTSETFTIPTGSTGNITYSPFSKETVWPNLVEFDTDNSVLKAVRVSDGVEFPIAGIPAGTYRLQLNMVIRRTSPANSATGTFGVENIVLTTSAVDADAWKPTFDIWVKNIWDTSKASGETDQQYAERVWGPILGDRLGNEAKLVFSTGFMSTSQDYEFKLAAYPVRDQSKSINGVSSEWKITLYKSDAEFDATGLYIPNATTGGKPAAGDKFFFIGIDMPHMYVTEAENRIQTTKLSSLDDIASIQPTWVIHLDKVRVHTIEDEDYGTALADRLSAGALLKVTDPRFTNGNVLSLYVQSITYTWNEPTDDNPYLVPDIEVVLSDKVVATTSAVERIQGDVNSIKQQYVKVADVESAVRRVADSLFLKKTGESDSSDSPTSFASRVSSRGFRQGGIGGKGWGLYRDNTKAMAEGEPEEEGDAVLEVDRLVVRKEMEVNSLAVNQISYLGGKEVISAAKIEITKVIETNNGYVCYFDQKQNSVQNNFVVNDIAMGQIFNPDDTEQRYYRRLVTAVGLDNVTLSKTTKDGSGVPQVGDVLVQYGNTSNTARQYVIVRDVVGGGYERMLSGLNSVSAAGSEYYFAGKQSNVNGPRWFVGDSTGEYAEWVNGRLNIKGSLIIRNADGSYQSMTDYMSSVQAQIDGQITSWSSSQATTAQTAPYPQYDDTTGQITGTPNFPASGWTSAADKERHFGDIYVDDSTGQGYRYTKRLIGSSTEYYWTRITDEQLAALQATVEGMQYLTSALLNGTTIVQGGLVLSSLIQLGQTENGVFKVYSGINGDLDETLQDPTRSIAAWYGGPMVDLADIGSGSGSGSGSSYAKSLFRHDGSGYLASGNIFWTPTGAGGIPGITWTTDNHVVISGDVQLASLGGDSVTELITLVQRLNNMFIDETYTEDGQTKHRVKVNANIYEGFYTDGFISAGGLNSGSGGGGGGVDLLRVWQSLTNNPSLQEYGNDTKISASHIPAATASTLGGVKVGSNLTINNGVLSGNYSPATTSADGLMSSTDKTKLNGIATAAQVNVIEAIQIGGVTQTVTNKTVNLPAYPTALASPYALTFGSKTYNGSEAKTITAADLGAITTETDPTVPAWAKATNLAFASLPAMYIGTTAVQSSSATQNLTGIGSISASGALTLSTVKRIYFGDTTHYLELDSNGFHFSHGVYSEDFISAGGLNSSGGGGGGGVDLLRVWQSLTNDPTLSAVQDDTKIALAHIPDITTSKVSNIETWIASKNYATVSQLITTARGLSDANDLFFKASNDEGEEVIIDDPGTTGTVLWGAESANQVALSVNGTSKTLLKAAAIEGLTSSVGVLLGYFSGGSAYNALALEGHSASYFATASALANLAYIVEHLDTGVTSVVGQSGDVTVAQIATALTGAGYKLTDTTYSEATTSAAGLMSATDKTKLNGIANGATNVTESTVSSWGFTKDTGTVTSVKVGNTSYNPTSGVVSLPAYPTVPTAVSAFTNDAGYLTSVAFADLTSHPTTLGGYGITDAKIANGTITLGSNTITPVVTETDPTVPAWAKASSLAFASLPSLYIGTTAVQNTSATQNLTGIGSITASGALTLSTTKKIYFGDTDHYLELDSNGFHFSHGVYSDSFITAGGVGSGGGGGSIDLDRVWESLTNNTDKPNVKINVAHIPDITTAKITDLASYNSFLNYYLKSEVYTKTEVGNLIAAIDQFHYEIYPSTSSVTDPQGNVLYLIGPTGSGSDKYEEYVYANNAWTKIGDTSIDLSPYLQASVAASTYQPLDADLTAIAGLTGTSGLLKKTAANTWTLDTNTYLTSVAFADLTSHPTTISGYGITDAKIANGVITLGSSTITPLTAHQTIYGLTLKNSEDTTVLTYNPATGSSSLKLTKALVGLSNVDNLAASGYFTLLENNSNQISITIGGTNKKLTVAYASNAGTLENHAASYFATASGLSTLAGRVSTLEGRTNWDDYFGIDANGAIYVKKIDENTPRDFYSYGAVTAGGVGTGGGGGGGVDIDRVWESLTNNTDKPNVKINIAHIPDITTAKVTDIESWIASKGYLTGNQSITLSGDVSGSGATSIAVTIGDGKVTNAKLANSSITIAGTSVSLGGAITAANLRSLLSINNVENTALSTWAGSTNITTLGTIATGVWNGTAIAANKLAIDFSWTLIGDSATYDSEDYIHVNS